MSAEGAERVATFADALERGDVDLASPTGTLQSRLSVPHARLRAFREVLMAANNTADLVAGLRGAAAAALTAQTSQPLIEVAWTFPGRGSPRLRTTGGVAREIIDGSLGSLLIVGFSITVDPDAVGLATQTVDAISRAAARGVLVTAVLHRKVNPNVLLGAWRAGVPGPSILTWPVGKDDKASVHAKLIVADRRDALVTSANLTYHGFEGNLEMGVRVTGHAAAEIHDQIHELIALRELVRWPG